MATTIWSKFFWADWLADTKLRRCSPAARGLWMDMLCIAAQAEPQGYLGEGEEAMGVEEIARLAGVRTETARRLIGELERRGVLSRDDKGRFFSRRIVRDAAAMARARRNGAKGGNPNLIKATGDGRDNPRDKPGLIAHKPESMSHKPESAGAGEGEGSAGPARAATGAGAALARAAAAMRVPVAALRRRTGWLIFGDMMAHLAALGCEAERDIWPTIERLSARLAEPPATPHYFRAAILEARDRRLGGGTALGASHVEWRDRLAVFAREGAWSSRWGPKPGEAGCLVPENGKLKTGIGIDPV
jgi:hypothetical protein